MNLVRIIRPSPSSKPPKQDKKTKIQLRKDRNLAMQTQLELVDIDKFDICLLGCVLGDWAGRGGGGNGGYSWI